MTLVDANNVERLPVIPQFAKRTNRLCLLLNAIVRANLEVTAVALISRELDPEHLLSGDCVLLTTAKQLSSLAGEHAAHDELNAASLAFHGPQEHCWAG